MRMALSQLQEHDPRTAQQLNPKTVVKRADDSKNAQGLANLLLATANPSGLSCSSRGTHQDATTARSRRNKHQTTFSSPPPNN
jgi:hypothetical protein